MTEFFRPDSTLAIDRRSQPVESAFDAEPVIVDRVAEILGPSINQLFSVTLSLTPSQDVRVSHDVFPLCMIDECPRCDAEVFDAEPTNDSPVFRCACCGTGWLYELGYVRPAPGPGHDHWA
jgi:hypothetical protein